MSWYPTKILILSFLIAPSCVCAWACVIMSPYAICVCMCAVPVCVNVCLCVLMCTCVYVCVLMFAQVCVKKNGKEKVV